MGRGMSRADAGLLCAARDGQAQTNFRRFPIIVVPGIMGSRVESRANGATLWDPDSKTAMLGLAALAHEFMRWKMDPTIIPGRAMAQPIKGGEFFDETKPAEQEDLIRRGWGGPSWNFYGAGMVAIDAAFKRHGGVTYGFGYDWRASSKENGKLLKEFIETTVRDRDGHTYRPIVVTHSMGGLVTRSCVSQGGKDLISAAVHTFMPTYGAPEAYTKFRLGQPGGWSPEDYFFSVILGRSAKSLTYRACGAVAVYELMPNHLYAKLDPDWLKYGQDVADASDSPPYSLDDPWKLYADSQGMLGLTREADWSPGNSVVWKRVRENISIARKFHKEVLADNGKGFHPVTFNLVSEGHAGTTVSATLEWSTNFLGSKKRDPNESECARVVSDDGDKTVPALSAHAASEFAKDPHVTVKGVEHAKGFNDPSASDGTIQLIARALRYLEKW